MLIEGVDIIQVIKAVVTLAATYSIARIVPRVLARIFEKTPLPENIEKGIVKASKYAIYVVGVFVTISILGVDLTSVIVGLGALSIAISFAMTNIIHNLISGILVQADKIFNVGDEIRIQAYEGKVVRISIRTTTIETKDGDIVSIPNSLFATNPVTTKKQAFNKV